MNVKERMEDICKISGCSESIVRRVLGAERDSVVNSLKRGEKATLIGRCTLELKSKIDIDTTSMRRINKIKITAKPAIGLESEFLGMTKLNTREDDLESVEGLMLTQIPGLG